MSSDFFFNVVIQNTPMKLLGKAFDSLLCFVELEL